MDKTYSLLLDQGSGRRHDGIFLMTGGRLFFSWAGGAEAVYLSYHCLLLFGHYWTYHPLCQHEAYEHTISLIPAYIINKNMMVFV